MTDRKAASKTTSAARSSTRPRLMPTLLQRPLTSFHLVLITGGLLLVVGFVMVFSASMFDSYQRFGSTYDVFIRQLMWIGIGLPAFWLGLRLAPRHYRTLAYPVLVLSIVALVLVLVPGIGVYGHGAYRWIDFGPLQLQPSEPAKLALALWGADLFVRKQRTLGEWRHLLIPLVPTATLLCALVMLEPDLGTTLCLVLVLFGLLWTLGAPARLFITLSTLTVTAICVLIVIEPYRLARVTSFLHPFDDRSASGYQAVQGLYSLSTGGFFGVGLGQSRMKWGLLPNAYTDYIFAILGEELGLIGCLVVLGLFAALAYTGVRIARRCTDPFVRLVCGAVTVWLSGQAIINIGYVSGMLPVTGIPLPLISFGGTSLVLTLFVLGMLASFARHEPAAVAYLRSRPPSRLTRWLAIPLPLEPVADDPPKLTKRRSTPRTTRATYLRGDRTATSSVKRSPTQSTRYRSSQPARRDTPVSGRSPTRVNVTRDHNRKSPD